MNHAGIGYLPNCGIRYKRLIAAILEKEAVKMSPRVPLSTRFLDERDTVIDLFVDSMMRGINNGTLHIQSRASSPDPLYLVNIARTINADVCKKYALMAGPVYSPIDLTQDIILSTMKITGHVLCVGRSP